MKQNKEGKKQMTYTETDKLKALAIVNIFETGKAFGDFQTVAVLDDGAGISYGISQFTHRSGSLAAVVARYFELGGVVGQRVIKSREAPLKKKGYVAVSTLENDEEFKKALQAAALTSEMQEAQMQIAFERYLKPALDICEAKNFVLPLSLAVVYDSVTHGSWEKISQRVGGTASHEVSGDGPERRSLSANRAAKPLSEKEWITEYARERDKWLVSVPRLKKTRYRTQFFLKQIAIGHWDLELPVTVNGTKLMDQIIAAKTLNETVRLVNNDMKETTNEPIQRHLPGMSNDELEKNYRISPATTPAKNPPEVLPGSPKTDRSQTRAVPPQSQEAVGSDSKQEEAGDNGESYLDKAEEAVNAAASKYDQAERIVNTVITRRDAAKSLWTTVVGTVWQTVWGIAAFLSGMPRVVWLVVAVLVGALMIGYLYRQIALGKIREKSRLSQIPNEN